MFAVSGLVVVKLEELLADEKISADGFKKIYEQNTDIIVIDVREENELISIRLDIKNLIWLPKSKIDSSKIDANYTEIEKVLGDDKNKKFFLHCNTHGRSPIALRILQALGYTNIIVVEGGIQELKKIMPTTTGPLPELVSSLSPKKRT